LSELLSRLDLTTAARIIRDLQDHPLVGISVTQGDLGSRAFS